MKRLAILATTAFALVLMSGTAMAGPSNDVIHKPPPVGCEKYGGCDEWLEQEQPKTHRWWWAGCVGSCKDDIIEGPTEPTETTLPQGAQCGNGGGPVRPQRLAGCGGRC